MFSANNTNTDNVESKKKEQANEVKTTDWKKFAMKFSTSFVLTICLGVVVFGACGLYTTKVAQSNILPSEVKFAPYTDTDYKLDSSADNPAKIFMNIIKIRPWKGFNFWDDPISVHSQEATFIKENFSDTWIFKTLCSLNESAKKNDTFSNMSYMMHDELKTNLANAFGIVNTIYSLLYKLPEWVVMLFYFTAIPFIGIFLLFYNGIRALITHLGNTSAAFREYNTENEEWEKWPLLDKRRGWLYFFWVIIVFIFYLFISFYLAIFMSFFTTIYSLFTPLSKEYNLKGSKETYGFGTFLRDTFVYKKSFILFLTAYTLLDSVKTYLNNSNYMIGCVIAILILAIGFNIFNPTDPSFNDVTQQNFTESPGKISRNITSKQVPANVKIDCPIKDKTLETTDNPLLMNADPSVSPSATPAAPSAAPVNNNPTFYRQPLFQTPGSGQPGSGPVITGGKKYIPRRLNKDGTSHQKYNFKLA